MKKWLLAFLAGFRNRVSGAYHDADSARQYGEAETARVLHKLHTRAFSDWLLLKLDQQTRDAVTRRIIAHVTAGWPRLGPGR